MVTKEVSSIASSKTLWFKEETLQLEMEQEVKFYSNSSTILKELKATLKWIIHVFVHAAV